MWRAAWSLCAETRALEGLAAARWEPRALAAHWRGVHTATPLSLSAQTVLSADSEGEKKVHPAGAGVGGGAGGGARRGGGGGPTEGPPPAGPPPPRRWPYAAAAALCAGLGGAYLYRKYTAEGSTGGTDSRERREAPEQPPPPPCPASGAAFPPRVQFLIAGAGTAAFAAMRAIRSRRPDATVLMVGAEHALPYMRPPLSKEVWREADLAVRARAPDSLTFRQWNGKRRPLAYEPPAFYAPVERLAEGGAGGAAVARGWTVTKIDVTAHTAELSAPGQPPVTIQYDKCLVATGVRARRVAALDGAAARGLSLALRGVADAAAIAARLERLERLERPRARTVAVLGGGFLATELAAALAHRVGSGEGGEEGGEEGGSGGPQRVVLLVPEAAPLAAVLPDYLARELARRLEGAGVTLVANAEVVSAAVVQPAEGGGDESVLLRLSDGRQVRADLVVEGAGAEFDEALARASGLEVHPDLGGLLVNAELQARTDVWAAGDAACFYDVALGRRRVEHHDHAVVSGRLAGANMAAAAAADSTPQHYTHQSMFWSDLGPQLGYEAIGIIDSRLPTVGIFSADAVHTAGGAHAHADTQQGAGPGAGPTHAEAPQEQQYERGVVLYLREKRVVGVLLWNLFNRVQVARQVVAQGEFEDLLEVGKLFAPHLPD